MNKTLDCDSEQIVHKSHRHGWGGHGQIDMQLIVKMLHYALDICNLCTTQQCRNAVSTLELPGPCLSNGDKGSGSGKSGLLVGKEQGSSQVSVSVPVSAQRLAEEPVSQAQSCPSTGNQ